MILRETEVKEGEIIWKVGDSAKYGLIVKEGQYKFFGCPETELGITFSVNWHSFFLSQE